MSRFWLVMVASSLLLVSGCSKLTKPQPVVVHVFRDLNSPYAAEADRRILEFQAGNPHLASGAPIVIQSVEELNYKAALQNRLGKDLTAEVVILNAAEDASVNPALQANLDHAENICGALKACPAMVPAIILPNSTGDQAAAQVFVDFLSKAK